MAVNDVTLIPAAELKPGAIGAIRTQVTKALLAQASRELSMLETELIVRDIRPQADLDWGSNTNFANAEVTTEIWTITTSSNTAYQDVITSASTAMADQRFVAIFGLRCARYTENTVALPCVSLVRIQVGNSIKAIWDLEQLYAYREAVVGVCNSAVVIPQNAQFQISAYNNDPGVQCDLQLEGIIVEPRGKVLSS